MLEFYLPVVVYANSWEYDRDSDKIFTLISDTGYTSKELAQKKLAEMVEDTICRLEDRDDTVIISQELETKTLTQEL